MTIRHVVSWKLATDDDVERQEHATEIARRLQRFAQHHPELVASLQVGANVVNHGTNFDLVLIADFDTLDALEAYRVHPEHVQIAEYVGGVVSARASVDFDL